MKHRYLIQATLRNKQGNIISHSVNSYKQTHPLQKFFAQQVGKPNNIYLHAEIRAMIAGSLSKDKPTSIYIERFDKLGNRGLSKPCIICVYAMIFFGIEHVYYSTKNGQLQYGTTKALATEYGLDYSKIKQQYSTKKHTKNASYLSHN